MQRADPAARRQIAARLSCAAIVASLTCLPGGSRAQSISTACSIGSPGFTFTYDPMSRLASQSISSVRITCTNVTGALPVEISLSTGRSQSFAARALAAPAHGGTLGYNVFYNGTRTVFGDGSGGTAHYQRVLLPGGTATSDAFGIELFVPPGQDVPVGSYSDVLELSVNF